MPFIQIPYHAFDVVMTDYTDDEVISIGLMPSKNFLDRIDKTTKSSIDDITIKVEEYDQMMAEFGTNRSYRHRRMRDNPSTQNLSGMRNLFLENRNRRIRWLEQHDQDLQRLESLIRPHSQFWDRFDALAAEGTVKKGPRYRKFRQATSKLKSWRGMMTIKTAGLDKSVDQGLREWLITNHLESFLGEIPD